VRFNLLAVFVLTLCACSVAWSDDTAKDDKKMEGTWLPTSAKLGDMDFPDEVRKTIKLVIKEGEYTVTVGEQKDHGTVKFDSSAKIKTMDVVGTEGPNKGKTILAIYELDGDTLTICYDLSGKNRPSKFETQPKTQLFLVTYKRQ